MARLEVMMNDCHFCWSWLYSVRRVNKIKIQAGIKPHKVESKAIFINFPTDKKVERRGWRGEDANKTKIPDKMLNKLILRR